MKLKIGVIFGGKSLEHELSILTAIQVMDNIDVSDGDLKKYAIADIILIVGVVLIIGSMIWGLIYGFMNPDMTEMRMFLSNPYPQIGAILGLITICISRWIDYLSKK